MPRLYRILAAFGSTHFSSPPFRAGHPNASFREKIDPFDIAEAAIYLSTLGKHAVVHQIVIDRAGADW